MTENNQRWPCCFFALIYLKVTAISLLNGIYLSRILKAPIYFFRPNLRPADNNKKFMLAPEAVSTQGGQMGTWDTIISIIIASSCIKFFFHGPLQAGPARWWLQVRICNLRTAAPELIFPPIWRTFISTMLKWLVLQDYNGFGSWLSFRWYL